MGYITILECDNCESHSEFERPVGNQMDHIPYSEILEDSEPRYFEINNWLFVAKLWEKDPIAITFEHYCPECKSDVDR